MTHRVIWGELGGTKALQLSQTHQVCEALCTSIATRASLKGAYTLYLMYSWLLLIIRPGNKMEEASTCKTDTLLRLEE